MTSRRLLALLVVLLIPFSSSATCNLDAVCSDATGSFAAWLETGGFTVGFHTDAGDQSCVSSYRLFRKMNGVKTPLTTIYPSGSCDTDIAYGYTDPTSASGYIYILEVWDFLSAEPACTKSFTRP